MNFAEILAENKLSILNNWIESVLDSYPADGARFFKKQQDRFANPLGYKARKGLEEVFELLISDQVITELPDELQQFIKLRAVQTFTPSEALAFVYKLKGIVVESCGLDNLMGVGSDWLSFNESVDRVALLVFDQYMADRELIYQIKVNEYINGNHVMARGKCPSAMMRKNKEEKFELKVIQDC